MIQNKAFQILKNTFNHKFDEPNFLKFIMNLFNEFNTEKAFGWQTGQYVYEPFRRHIKSFKRIGQYIDPDYEELDVLLVKVQSKNKLERTRTALRNFAVEYLKRKERDFVLIAFFSEDSEDWRFSFIKLEYSQYLDKKERVRTKEEYTPARRYSFLVGKNEPSHTAQQHFLPLLTDTKKNPFIVDIENAFSIEKVTNEFFQQYFNLFIKLKKEIQLQYDNTPSIRNEFNEKNININSFTKKTLGQIVFLYFIQKKAWLGVPRNQNFDKGDRKFLTNLFLKKFVLYDNFFNDILKYLFYDALAKEHNNEGIKHYYKKLLCRIPFLNGGLFEPENNFDWKNTELNISNELFFNEKKSENDKGTGILNVFDRYNFTVREDEPLEKEVAVDPEMLGKVFENLLDVSDRKAKGAFYTPREIVHYMCQQSIINHLDNTLNFYYTRSNVI